MGWDYDRPPLEYLQRRIVYYKKKKGVVNGLAKNEFLIKKYRKRQLKKIIAQRIQEIDSRIVEFTEAVTILKQAWEKRQ